MVFAFHVARSTQVMGQVQQDAYFSGVEWITSLSQGTVFTRTDLIYRNALQAHVSSRFV